MRISRRIKFAWQRLIRGYSEEELWSLDHTIAKFAYPRFKAFRGRKAQWHETDAQYDADLVEIEWILEKMASDEWPSNLREPKELTRAEAALALFGKHLWTFWT